MTEAKLKRMYKVDRQTINKIIHRKSWKHI